MGKIDEKGISYIQGEILESPGYLQDTYMGDMMTSAGQTEDISSTLHLLLNVAAERYHVNKLALFGSRARCDMPVRTAISISWWISLPVLISPVSPV